MSNTKVALGIAGAIALSLGVAEAPFGSGAASASETIRIGNECDFPPFSQRMPDGSCVGFDIDVIDFVCDHMGVTCEIVVQEWTGIIPALYAGRYDAIISSMSVTDDRKTAVLFSQPYYRNQVSFIAQAGRFSGNSPEDLAGASICTFRNSNVNIVLESDYTDSRIVYHDGAEQIKLDMEAGRCDAFLETFGGIYGMFLDTPEADRYELLGDPFTVDANEGAVAMAVRNGDEALVERLNAAIDAMYESSAFREINDRYFPFDLSAR